MEPSGVGSAALLEPPVFIPRLSIRCDYCSALDTDRDGELPETAGWAERHRERHTHAHREREAEGERRRRERVGEGSTALSLPCAAATVIQECPLLLLVSGC